MTPGMIIIKNISVSGDFWAVWHKELPSGQLLRLNESGEAAGSGFWGNLANTENTFTVSGTW